MSEEKKPITMRDIAKMCGVSVAAVSYTLNGRDDQRISEATKEKILQIANLYQYRLNPYAKSLASGELHNILFFYEETSFSLYKAEIMNFINELAIFLKQNSYNLIIAPSGDITKYDYVDGIITYRISNKTFRDLASKNYVPVISVDCFIDDDLFFQINNDINKIDHSDNVIYLSFEYGDNVINQSLQNLGNVYLIKDLKSLVETLTANDIRGKTINCLNKEIYNFVRDNGLKANYTPVDTKEKFHIIFETLKLAMSRVDSSKHSFLI